MFLDITVEWLGGRASQMDKWPESCHGPPSCTISQWNVESFLTTPKQGPLLEMNPEVLFKPTYWFTRHETHVTASLSQAISPLIYVFLLPLPLPPFDSWLLLALRLTYYLSYTNPPLLRWRHTEDGVRKKEENSQWQTLSAFVSSVWSISCSLLGF